MSAFRVIRRFRDLLDVNWGSFADQDVAQYDSASGKLVGVPMSAGADLADAVILAPAASARNVIVPTDAAAAALTIRAAAGAQAFYTDLISLRDEANAYLLYFDAGGEYQFNIPTGGTFQVATDAMSTGLTIQKGGGGAAEIGVFGSNAAQATNVDTLAALWTALKSYGWLDATSDAPASLPPSGAAGGVLAGTYPNPSFAADMATQAELDAHTGDTSDAHDASAISAVDAGGYFAGTDLETITQELGADVGSQASDLATHEADTTTHGATGAIVGTTNTQTLTAKTLNSFTNVIEADAVHIEVYNNTGSTIAIGTPVYVSGANLGEQLPEVTPADASLLATMPAIGLTEAAIPTGTRGGVDRIGRVANVDTSAYTVGALLYVSETTGQLTATRPSAPAISQQMGRVLYSHATLGVIDVFAADALIPATETAVGGVELATTAEAAARADTSRAVTPAGLDAALDAHEAAADPHAGYLLESLFDANTVLKADSDNTPAALTMGASTILARLAAGNIKAASVAEIVALLQAYTVGGTDVAVADGGTGASTAVGGFTALAAGIPSLSAATTIGLTDNAVLDVGGTPSKITGANFRKTVARSEGLMRAQGFVSWNYDPVVTWSTVTFLSGYFLAASVYFFAGEVITNVHMIVNTAGTSVTKGSVGVFSTSGTLLASSANDTTIWTATAGFRTVALSSPYTVLTEGPLYLGAVAVHTGTNPTINRGQNSTTHGQGIGGGTDRYKFLSGQTDLPNPATWAAQNSHGGWFGAS